MTSTRRDRTLLLSGIFIGLAIGGLCGFYSNEAGAVFSDHATPRIERVEVPTFFRPTGSGEWRAVSGNRSWYMRRDPPPAPGTCAPEPCGAVALTVSF